ncbi:MAG TPA: L-seryl-tRNA(Sec) selenium transferase [Bacillales bacterium]|nr:L-seryl-tRNA(Sec) selenium transferase [Bacillales bacterium]
MKAYMRYIPAVHVLQQDPVFKKLSEDEGIPEQVLTSWLQEETDQLRRVLLDEQWQGAKPSEQVFTAHLLKALGKRVQNFSKRKLRSVINGTGVVIHTNLGRARLGENAVRAVEAAAVHYSNLEYDLEKGKRGSRHDIVESLLCEVTGAEAAMVVNNNAAAVYLVLRALAQNSEVIVSRGQLVEIGGSFRISAIMEESGARLVEVGTTNKTHYYDYEEAVNEETAMLMKVHTSNFKISGFTESVETNQLADLAKQRELVFYEDLGSGAFYDFASHGIGEEPLVSQVLGEGVDLVTCSGDKLLGGPQAGIIAGKKQWIDRLKKHQLARVLRVDKMTFAALEATLKDYVRHRAAENVPTVRDILMGQKEIKARSERFIEFASEAVPGFHSELRKDESQIGGGTMPDVLLPTWGVLIGHDQFSPQRLSDSLRACNPPVITRMKDEQVFIDFRTVSDAEMETLLGSLRQLQL